MLYSRWTSFIGFCLCVVLLGFAAYLQYHLGLRPCPLCVLQRLLFVVLGFIFLAGALYTPYEKLWRRVQSGLIVFVSLLGVLVAGRHVWLTLQPAGSVPTCSPTLDYMLSNLPFQQTLQIMFQGSGDCARQPWHFLNMNMPEWTLIIFLAFTLFGIVRFVVAENYTGR